jgi:hypothetical protein
MGAEHTGHTAMIVGLGEQVQSGVGYPTTSES